MLDILLINSYEPLNILASAYFEEQGISSERVDTAKTYEEALSKVERLEAEGKRKTILVSSEVLDREGFRCSSDIIERAIKGGHEVVLYSSKRREQMQESLKRLVDGGLPNIFRGLDNFESPESFYNTFNFFL